VETSPRFFMTGELWFYHLEKSSLEEALPELLEKTLARGWRALVCSPDGEDLKDIDKLLWTFRADSFLPHGLATQPDPDQQNILLSTQESNLNQAQCLFAINGAVPENLDGFERSIVMFDGGDEVAVNASRRLWKAASGDGRNVSYWRQSPEGRWEKKA
jgi:DNA polymerase-3 subunit chi